MTTKRCHFSRFFEKRGLRDLGLDLVSDLIGSIFYAIGIYTFASRADFAPGGISGLSLIANHLWGFPIGTVSLLLNIPFILMSYRIVGRRFMFKSVRSILFCTVMLDLVFPHTPAYSGDPLLAALFSGLFFGAGLALIYMRGSSTGGTDFLTMSIKALRPHLSIGFVTMLIDLFIILLGWPVFGNVDAVLYGLISTFITSADKIMYGVDEGKLAIIITSKGGEVARQIDAACARGSTVIRAQGAYTRADLQVLLCACSKSESYKVRSAAHQVDPGAFVMLTETSQVFGEGFIDPRENVKIG